MSATKPKCSQCSSPKPRKACAACSEPYCSAACQRLAWPTHKATCSVRAHALARHATVPPAPPTTALDADSFSSLIDALAAAPTAALTPLTALLTALMNNHLPVAHFDRTARCTLDAAGSLRSIPRVRGFALRILGRLCLGSGAAVALGLVEVAGVLPLLLRSLDSPKAFERLGGMTLLGALVNHLSEETVQRFFDTLVSSGALRSVFTLLARCRPSSADAGCLASQCIQNLCTGSEARKEAAMAAGAAKALTAVLRMLNEEGDAEFSVLELGGQLHILQSNNVDHDHLEATVDSIALAIATLTSGPGMLSRSRLFTLEGVEEELGFCWADNPELGGLKMALVNLFASGGETQAAVLAAVPLECFLPVLGYGARQ